MHYTLVTSSLRVAITEGVLRAVGIGRRRSFYVVALRYRVAYSLEHHNGFLRVLRCLDTSRNRNRKRPPQGSLKCWNYNIGMIEMS